VQHTAEFRHILVFLQACPNLFEALKSGDVYTAGVLLVCINESCIGNDPLVGTPLIYAAGYGHVEVVQMLLEDGANVDRAEEYGFTALHVAAANGHLDVCRLLLDWGATVDPLDEWQDTPLHLAAMRGHLSVVKLLVESGADVWLQNDSIATATEEAQSEVRKMENVTEWLDSVRRGQGESTV
jgi:ankyrin repeat protein